MKKLFTFAAALLASVAMMAADFEPTAVYRVGDATTLGAQWKSLNQNANYFEVADTVVFSPFVLYQSAATGWQEWTGCAGSGSSSTSWNAIAGRCFLGSSAMFESSAKLATTKSDRTYYYHVTNCTQAMALVKSGSSLTVALRAYEIVESTVSETASAEATYANGNFGVVSIEGLDATKTYRIEISNAGTSNASVAEVAFVGPQSTDPMLNVNPAEVTLAVTAAKAQDEATVKFTGKNLAAGTYNLTIPNLAGLTVSPTSVTVGEDGKLNQDVTIAYTSTVDVAAASASISLTIGELSKSVAINYSAVMAKSYINASVNIEQWVLDNGTRTNDFKAVLDAANIEYNNIDALDSLNDEKDYRNYPYLGIKLKKADAALRCWLQAGNSISVKFGNVGADFKVIANGVEQTLTAEGYANLTVDGNKVLTLSNAPEDMYLEIVCNSTKTLVVKQIMFNEAIAPVVLPEPTPTAINNTEATVKAVKMVRNGQLFIEKNGVLYNAQGAVVK